MSLFAVEYTYSPEKSSGRDDHRTDHHAWLAELARRHILHSMHPLGDGSGTVMVVDAKDKESVARLFRHDPYSLADLVDNVQISEWTPPPGEFDS
ncbi:YciI family protein [Rhodococcus sp. NPDC049939]|uniref:YciI family protein n=1 Tax=Rhodococcus sp. NPDC049939 TaxID=3155511 RepID=UPI003407C99A